MFRMKKTKKDGMNVLKDSLIFGSGVLAERMGNGVKYAGSRMGNVSDYMRRNQNISMLTDKISSRPTGSLLAIAGIGLAIYGLVNLLRK